MTWNYKAYSEIDVTVPNKWNPELCVELRSGLVFDGAFAGLHPGTLRYVDGSELGNDGTLTGMTPADWVFLPELGRFGTVGASGKYIISTAPNGIPGNSALTVVNWLRSSNRTANYTAIMYNSADGANDGWRQQQYLSNLIFVLGGVGSYANISPPANNTWFCWISTWTGSGGTATNRYWALDGTSVTNSQSTGNLLGTPTRLTVQAYSSTQFFWVGMRSDTMIYNRVLSLEEQMLLANPANRLYVPDTRTRLFAPLVTGWKPWLQRRQRHRLGAA